ncbi:DUF676-domain-containing protein [Epithele typhae]|uniref:DUF676-domain-containing protein n=1 Tax=Epithele typhae TaxID=378194 RepID=UPI002008D8AD|nr:DUF676-domain-containing protein [Epithele typhae]KAH9940836.1 DUF676-domain-containing protein [Epithele typhae]
MVPGEYATETVHLLVLVHGMWGNPSHLAETRRVMLATRGAAADASRSVGPGGERLHVLVAETNQEAATYDGIDWGGERVAEEIYAEVKSLQKEGRKVTRFSVTGYSLGGLVSRYVIGILHQRGFFDTVTPVNFNTLATPHIGLPKYPTFLSSLTNYFGPKLLSRTGEQFYTVDKWSKNGRPLLEVMADPSRIFYQALASFQHVRIYANAVNDLTVPYVTAAIKATDPFLNHEFNGVTIELDETYPAIIKSYNIPEQFLAKPQVTPLSSEWFKSMKPRRPMLPPPLQFGFPFNLVIYAMTPLLIPLFMSLVLTRLSAHPAAEKEGSESGTERLAHIVGKLEHDMEGAMLEIFEGDFAENGTASSPARLKKELAWFPNVMNAHAVIISRDVKRFPVHKEGESVLQHWADHWII